MADPRSSPSRNPPGQVQKMVIVEPHFPGEEIIEINNVYYVSTSQLAGMGHLHFAIDAVSGKTRALTFFIWDPDSKKSKMQVEGIIPEQPRAHSRAPLPSITYHRKGRFQVSFRSKISARIIDFAL